MVAIAKAHLIYNRLFNKFPSLISITFLTELCDSIFYIVESFVSFFSVQSVNSFIIVLVPIPNYNTETCNLLSCV